MVGINIVIGLLIFFFANSQLTGQNYINKDTRAVIYSKNKDTNYKVIIPKDTLFTMDHLTKDNSDDTTELIKMFDFQVNNSEFKIKKGTTIKLLKETYIYYNEETSLKLISNDKLSKSDFYNLFCVKNSRTRKRNDVYFLSILR